MFRKALISAILLLSAGAGEDSITITPPSIPPSSSVTTLRAVIDPEKPSVIEKSSVLPDKLSGQLCEAPIVQLSAAATASQPTQFLVVPP